MMIGVWVFFEKVILMGVGLESWVLGWDSGEKLV